MVLSSFYTYLKLFLAGLDFKTFKSSYYWLERRDWSDFVTSPCFSSRSLGRQHIASFITGRFATFLPAKGQQQYVSFLLAEGRQHIPSVLTGDVSPNFGFTAVCFDPC
jgi:hypothetical protein